MLVVNLIPFNDGRGMVFRISSIGHLSCEFDVRTTGQALWTSLLVASLKQFLCKQIVDIIKLKSPISFCS
jgi:hypothetical protein